MGTGVLYLMRNFSSNLMYLYKNETDGDHAVKFGREVLILYLVAFLASLTSSVHVFS